MIQGFRKETMVNDLFLLSDRQMARISSISRWRVAFLALMTSG